MNKKLYIFAVNALVDSKYILEQAVEQTLDQAGYETGLADLASKYAFDINDALSLPEDDETRELLNRVFQLYESNVQPMRGAANALQTVTNKCVVTGDARIMARLSLLKAGLMGFFDERQLFTLEIFQPERVPFSELLKFAARSMEFKPDQCVFVTDEIEGIQAANDAGMRSIGFIGGSHILSASIENEMKAAGANNVIANMSEFSSLKDAA